ncbi:MAG: glutathione synthase [Gammaproteobacteria bacterium]|nr:glutathione synthase [Gammaproteobacteria bacterium]
MIKLALLMDPIGTIKPYKDSSLAMALAAQARGWQLYYLEMGDLFLRDGRAYARARELTVRDDAADWFSLGASRELPVSELDVLLMRKDPPIDTEYLYATQMLALAEAEGTLVVNRSQALREANEKLASTWFPQCAPPTLVTRDQDRLRAFLAEQGDVIIKPLDAMGGASIFRVRADDPNTGVIFETLTEHGGRYAMVQRFIPEIAAGDKRILLIDGEPVPYALARVPAKGETRGNLAAGGTGVGVALSDRDRWICEQVGPRLKAMGLMFVGLDVIGDYLTEINVTSPTCIRELDRLYGLDIAGQLMDVIESKLREGGQKTDVSA